MLRKIIIALTLIGSGGIVSATAWAADASLSEVYQATEAGKLTQAQAMMAQVLHDHPTSAKAHYVEAELLAKQGRLADGDAELKIAQRLSPGLPFARVDSVRQLESRLATHGARQSTFAGVPVVGQGMSMTLLLVGVGVVVCVFLIGRAMRNRDQQSAGRAGLVPASYGNGGGPPMGAMGGGVGSGIMGSLATGVAVGAGVVAGEALLHHMLDGNHADTYSGSSASPEWQASNAAPDTEDFGVADNSSWDDDSSSSAGGDDWT